MALKQVDDLDRRIAEMQSMKNVLQTLASSCQGDTRPECPILDRLGANER
ncbi:MAG: hypothetical protein ABIN96_01950 [Rubrivivax sp.]